jgi:hypothetical protein
VALSTVAKGRGTTVDDLSRIRNHGINSGAARSMAGTSGAALSFNDPSPLGSNKDVTFLSPARAPSNWAWSRQADQ